MDIAIFDPEELPSALRVLRGVVESPTRNQARYLETIARLHGVELRASRLIAAPGWLGAAVILEPQARQRLVQLAIMLVMLEGRIARRDARAVGELARALDVEEPTLRVLSRLASLHALQARAQRLSRLFGNERWSQLGKLVSSPLAAADEMLSLLLRSALQAPGFGLTGIGLRASAFRLERES